MSKGMKVGEGEGKEKGEKGPGGARDVWLAFKRELRRERLKSWRPGAKSGVHGALEERLKEALSQEFECLAAEFKDTDASALADTFKRLKYRESEAGSQKRIEKALMGCCAAGGFDASLRAVEASMGWESPLRPGTLALAMAKEASRPSASPEEARRRVGALADAKAIWDPKSVLGQASKAAREPVGWRYDAQRLEAQEEACAQLIGAAMRRPACAEAAALTIRGLREREEQGWGQLGDGVAKRMGPSMEQDIPEALRRGLAGAFWLALKTGIDSESGLSKSLLNDLLCDAKTDSWLREQLCLSVWSGLSLREIRAFESAFPGESQQALERALSDASGPGSGVSGGSWELWAGLEARVSRASKTPVGQWAAGLEGLKGLRERSSFSLVARRDEKTKALFMELRAVWEALELGSSLEQAPAGGASGRL